MPTSASFCVRGSIELHEYGHCEYIEKYNTSSQGFYTSLTIMPTKEDTSIIYEAKLKAAMEDIHEQGFRANGRPIYSFRQAAKDYEVSKTTLMNRFNGRRSHRESRQTLQRLTPAQEERVVEFVKTMGHRKIPLTPTTITECASRIAGGPLGKSWLWNFRKRHPELKARWASGLEACRAQALNPTTVSEYLKLLGKIIEDYDIPPENIYNMDEKGIQLGVGVKTLTLVDRNQANVQQVVDGNRELVTVIETICADGTALRPSFVYKGRHWDLVWEKSNVLKAL